MARTISELSPEELLAVAISLEEEDAKIYADFYRRLAETHPATAMLLATMRDEETGHATRLTEMFHTNYKGQIPLVRRQDVKGLPHRKPIWLSGTLSVAQVRDAVSAMEAESLRFYQTAAKQSSDARVRDLLNDLAATEKSHIKLASTLRDDLESSGKRQEEDDQTRRAFILHVIQPGLAGLMDGSVSTLAPVFAAAYATQHSWYAFLVGMAASIGAGISMGFAEALSDDGVLSGRGHPLTRGIVCGAMTTLGGIGHTLPFLIADFRTAMIVAVGVVAVELAVISWIRHKYMDTPLLAAAFQVVVGGVLVFLTGILIGSA
ncbi:MAG: iron exporter MbfA [Terrimicrobiaceae bacterium]